MFLLKCSLYSSENKIPIELHNKKNVKMLDITPMMSAPVLWPSTKKLLFKVVLNFISMIYKVSLLLLKNPMALHYLNKVVKLIQAKKPNFL